MAGPQGEGQGICAVDADEIACACGRERRQTRFDLDGVVSAVRVLQTHGLNVILIACNQREELQSRLAKDPAVRPERLLHVQGCGGPTDERLVGLIRIAEEYSCAFTSNGSFRSVRGEEEQDIPWQLPCPLRDWLRSCCDELQVRYSFAPPPGCAFRAALPTGVTRWLQRQRAVAASAATPSATSIPTAPATGSVRHSSFVEGPGAINSSGGTGADLGAAAAGQIRSPRDTAVPRVISENGSKKGEPPPPPSAPAQGAEKTGNARARKSASPGTCGAASGTDLPEPSKDDKAADVACAALESCVVVVRRGVRVEQMLCIRCEDPAGSLFKSAHSLSADMTCISGDGLKENDGEDLELEAALKAHGGYWAAEPNLTLTVGNGCHAGLRGVGVGSNLKKRRRAAHLALAISAATPIPGNTGMPSLGRAGNTAGLSEMIQAVEQARASLVVKAEGEEVVTAAAMRDRHPGSTLTWRDLNLPD